MKNKITFFFLAISILTSFPMDKFENHAKNLDRNNKISKQQFDEKKSEIKKEVSGWASWSTTEKVIAVSLAAVCVTVVIIGSIVLKIEYDIRNPKTPPGSNPFGQNIAELNNHINTLDKIIEKFDKPSTS